MASIMESAGRAVLQDLDAAIAAFAKDRFDMMNIFANRLMANVVFGATPLLALAGFFAKDIAFTYGVLKRQGGDVAFSTAKSIGVAYLETLKSAIHCETPDEDKLWRNYHDLRSKLRGFALSEFETGAYTDDEEFAKDSVGWLLKYLDGHKETLLNPNNVLLKGIPNEIDRVFRVHGGSLVVTYAVSLLVALDRYYQYLVLSFSSEGPPQAKSGIREVLFPLVDTITSLLLSDERIDSHRVDTLLWDLVKGWREFFIQFMDVQTRPGMVVERGIELPEDAKRDLAQALTGALEKETGKKARKKR